MKPRNREVNIFNMSVLDLLTGALGAFCFLTLALFPSYFKANQAQASPAKTAPAETAAQLNSEQDRLEKELAGVQASKTGIKPFTIASAISTDSQGNNCASLRIDRLAGPGGTKFIKQRVTSVFSTGAPTGVLFFTFQPGTYKISLETIPQSAQCFLQFSQSGPGRPPRQTWQLGSAPSSREISFEVKTEYFNYQLFPNG
ncbi:MAG TPA: hypothetical protein VMV27_06955 [Candidatus Binataceae bacterium]|nr:hypothetical protein [Candidatus Binataceae bacterium]HVB82904.1 hypothetical protein [Candidatus Binataceae bacterium]